MGNSKSANKNNTINESENKAKNELQNNYIFVNNNDIENIYSVINGRREYGQIFYRNGNYYCGELKIRMTKNCPIILEGNGTMYYNTKDTYKGEWENGHFNGYGIMYLRTGDEYQGNWKNGMRHGSGKMIYKDGKVLEGKWENGIYLARIKDEYYATNGENN